MIATLPTVTVSVIYLAWKACQRDRDRLRRDRALRQRVAYMLWVAAQGGAGPPDRDADDDEPPDNDLERRLKTYSFLDRR